MVIYETNKEIIKKAEAVASKKGWELLKIRHFNKNPKLGYLKFVLCKRGENDYCTLLFNTDGNGGKGFFVEGHYGLKTYEQALDDLNARM